MAGRPGFFGGSRQGDLDAPSRDGGFGGTPAFDPVWGTLGPPGAQADDPWRASSTETADEGLAFDVEIFGDGFQISGQVRTGQISRLSDWLNVKTGFVMVQDGMHVRPDRAGSSDPGQPRGTLWVRLDQIVLVAERANIQQARLGAPMVQKERRKVTIVTPGYELRGSLHVHANGSMKEYLEPAEPRFLPITEVTVRWLSDPALVARVPFAMINRQQMITILDEPSAPSVGSTDDSAQSAADDSMPLHRRFGAA
ncbi:MAG: hypothetical protein ACXWN4_06765 [Candidatus Limnocylindrales bacterium]